MYGPFLICCEGKTEKEYLDILKHRIFRIPSYVKVQIEGEKGQHKALVDRVVELRADFAEEEGFVEDQIECWAVCDDDGMRGSYSDLKKYAESRGVNLAFSRPQFESFLMQHFEQSKETDPSSLYRQLGCKKNALGFEGEYDKADLSWLEKTLIDRPKLVKIAIVNSDQRVLQSTSPFLTVQNLVRRLMQMSRN